MLKLTRFFVSIALICLLGLLTATVHAADITVDSSCSLADAITAANSDAASGGCPAGSDADTIALTGNVTLDSPLPVIESEITIEGNGHTISGNKQHQIFWVEETGALTVQNATLADGRGADDDDLYDEDLYIGGAIVNFDRLDVRNGSFTGNSADWGGAIVNLGESSASISDSEFTGNTADRGGAIVNLDESSVNISDSTFTENTHMHYGGTMLNADNASISIGNSAFINNSGIAIVNEGESNIKIRGSSFTDHRGSAIDNGYMATVSINSSYFRNNSDDFHGGAIYNNGVASISDSNFTGNSARRLGGAIWTSGKTSISDSLFEGNLAAEDGGAIFDRDGETSIRDSSFLTNSANEDGGAIYIGGALFKDGNSSITSSLFTGNSAGDEGGAIRGAEDSDVNVRQSIFRDNEAEDGGAIYSWGELSVDRSTFINNSAVEEGGGIANHGMARINSSILANNPGGDCHLGRNGELLESGQNHISDGSCGAAWSGPVADGYCPPGQQRDGQCQIGAPSQTGLGE